MRRGPSTWRVQPPRRELQHEAQRANLYRGGRRAGPRGRARCSSFSSNQVTTAARPRRRRRRCRRQHRRRLARPQGGAISPATCSSASRARPTDPAITPRPIRDLSEAIDHIVITDAKAGTAAQAGRPPDAAVRAAEGQEGDGPLRQRPQHRRRPGARARLCRRHHQPEDHAGAEAPADAAAGCEAAGQPEDDAPPAAVEPIGEQTIGQGGVAARPGDEGDRADRRRRRPSSSSRPSRPSSSSRPPRGTPVATPRPDAAGQDHQPEGDRHPGRHRPGGRADPLRQRHRRRPTRSCVAATTPTTRRPRA